MTRRWGAIVLLIAGCGGEDAAAPRGPDVDAADALAIDAPQSDATAADSGDASRSPPALAAIADRVVAEDELLVVPVVATDAVSVAAVGLPPGARFDRKTRAISFRPDFIQGGLPPTKVTVQARNAAGTAEVSFAITVTDTIHPPELAVTKTEDLGSCRRLTLGQKTDAYTDSPGYAGRTFTAIAVVPKTASKAARVPLRVPLHGLGGAPSASTGCSAYVVVQPHDPMNSYFWGYSANLPGGSPTTGKVPPYTARRVLQLVDWAHRTQGGDPNRTFITGSSMGGAGAMTIGLLWARHFAGIDAWLGQAIARNHRPARLATLEKLWGTRAANLDDGAGMGVWDRLDLTRVLRDEDEAAGQFLFLKHGKDDATIHFGAVTVASPLTKQSFYQALRGHPHYAVWDEGGHGPADPVMPDGWWDGGWSRIGDATAFLGLDRVVPAFANASHDGDPGDGTGNGKVAWDESSGFAANVTIAGDTGWKGELAGALNRHLRWDATKVVDTTDRLELPLRVLSGTGKDPPRAGYPTIDDKVAAKLPIVVDVTLRRVQRFVADPGEKLAWEHGAQKGELTVGSDGTITVPRVALGTEWTTLVVRR
ncbi:MAG: hypothetical protein HYV09_38380 [Deltaproteobacteria bacterium]|nr:hypothetical protein [Deltaproteobacteria bacterium]